jgi:hypothetical protein
MDSRADKISVERYLTYLDKEMTIMGILSGFCAAALGLSIKLLTSKNVAMSQDLLHSSQLSLFMAHLMVLFAALSFYGQRSLLAWYYGQISLEDSGYDTGTRLYTWLQDADGWDTWIRYQRGFWLLSGAFCESVIAGLRIRTQWPGPITDDFEVWGGSIVAIILLVVIIVQKIILGKWSHSENPYREFRKAALSVLIQGR